MEVILSDQQAAALKKIISWWDMVSKNPEKYRNTRSQVCIIMGSAGTGKSFLINYVISNILKLQSSDIVFVTPTAKASMVLIKEGSESQTIHRFLYNVIPQVKFVKIGSRIVTLRSTKFIRRRFSKELRPKLIICDELGMVSEQLMDDLLSVGSPVLGVGDPKQLPPVMAKCYTGLDHPDYVLTEIMRQKSDNAIVKIADDFRNDKEVPNGNYGNGQVLIMNHEDMYDKDFEKLLLSVDQVICGKNGTRAKLNNMIRELLGYDTSKVSNGEKIVCDMNDYDIQIGDKYSLVNGMTGKVNNFAYVDKKLGVATISFKPDISDKWIDDIFIDADSLLIGKPRYQKRQRIYLMPDGSAALAHEITKKQPGETLKEYRKRVAPEFILRRKSAGTALLNQFSMAYCESLWKTQGGTYDSILFLDETRYFPSIKYRMLYTAITRAKSRAIIIR